MANDIKFRFVSNKPIPDKPGFSCWCYEIRIIPQGWMGRESKWGLKLPSKTYVADPENFDVKCDCKLTPSDYVYLKGKKKEPSVIVNKKKGRRKFKICFISTSEMKLETNFAVCRKYRDRKWEFIKFDGTNKLPGPKPQ